MPVDRRKIRDLLYAPPTPGAPTELRRQEDVFWVGSLLSPHNALETIFDSDCLKPVDLFILSFDDPEQFRRAEELVMLLKKNFRGFLLGRFKYIPDLAAVERAYATGIDMIELPPLPNRQDEQEGERILAHAQSIFPRWSVLSSLSAEGRPADLCAEIDRHLARQILPLLTMSPPVSLGEEEIAEVYSHLNHAWRRAGAVTRPLRPLLDIATPLTSPRPRKGLGGFIDRVDDARLRTFSDLRRMLRVREVEESFESAGL